MEAAQKLRDDMPSDMFIDELFHHRLALAASALAISGCFVPPRMDTRDAPPALPTARDVNLGAVCVSGQTRDPMMGFAYFADNGVTVGAVGDQTGFCYLVEPGTHDVRASWATQVSRIVLVVPSRGRIDLRVSLTETFRPLVLWQVGPRIGEEIRRSVHGAEPRSGPRGDSFEPPSRPIKASSSVAPATSVRVCIEHHFQDSLALALGGARVTPVRAWLDGRTIEASLGAAERRCVSVSRGPHRFGFTALRNDFDGLSEGLAGDELLVEDAPDGELTLVAVPRGAGRVLGPSDPRYDVWRRGSPL